MTEFYNSLIGMARNARSTFLRVDLCEPRLFAANMRFLYDTVRATERLFEEALIEAVGLPQSEFRDAFKAHVADHLTDEHGHLALLEHDLVAGNLGIPPRPDPLAMALVGTQYYMIKHLHPASILGYMAACEADPPTLDLVERMEHIHGRECMTFIREHAKSDIEHQASVREIIEEAPADLYGPIWHSADSALRYYGVAVASWGNA